MVSGEDVLRDRVRGIIAEISSLGGMPSERGGNSSSRYLPAGQSVRLNPQKLVGFEQVEFPVADDPIGSFTDHSLHLSPSLSTRLSNTVRREPGGVEPYVDANRAGAGEELAGPDVDAILERVIRRILIEARRF